MPNPEKRPVCDFYRPGHLVHWIQARKASEPPASWGKLGEVDEGWITVNYLDRTSRYRNHDAAAVLAIAEPGDKVRVSEPYRMFGVELANHVHKGFCVALESDEWIPCSYDPLVDVTPDALADKLNTRGGFSV